MRLDRMITLGLDRVLGGLGLDRVGGRRVLPVLMYHSLSADAESVADYYKVCTTPARFRAQMGWMKRHGYAGVDLASGIRWLRGEDAVVCGIPAGMKPVAVTFDDGFQDFHVQGLPVLVEHGFRATMYVPTAYVGGERRRFLDRPCMTWGELRECVAAGVEMGSHTVSHPVLYSLSWREIEGELRDSKSALEQHLQKTMESFAHPFAIPAHDGEYMRRLEEVLRLCGFGNCVTTLVGRMTSDQSPYRIKRLPANDCDDEGLLLAKLRGSYDWMGGVQGVVKLRKKLARSRRHLVD